MGYIAHDAVIAVVDDWDEETLGAIDALADEMPEAVRPFLVGPVVGTNGYHSWAFLPDGSKEGWPASDEGALWRDRFAEVAKGQLRTFEDESWYRADVVHIRFGGDHGSEVGTTIVSTTDVRQAVAS